MGQRRVTIAFGSILFVIAIRNYSWSRKSIQRDLIRKSSEDNWAPQQLPSITRDVDRELDEKEQAFRADNQGSQHSSVKQLRAAIADQQSDSSETATGDDAVESTFVKQGIEESIDQAIVPDSTTLEQQNDDEEEDSTPNFDPSIDLADSGKNLTDLAETPGNARTVTMVRSGIPMTTDTNEIVPDNVTTPIGANATDLEQAIAEHKTIETVLETIPEFANETISEKEELSATDLDQFTDLDTNQTTSEEAAADDQDLSEPGQPETSGETLPTFARTNDTSAHDVVDAVVVNATSETISEATSLEVQPHHSENTMVATDIEGHESNASALANETETKLGSEKEIESSPVEEIPSLDNVTDALQGVEEMPEIQSNSTGSNAVEVKVEKKKTKKAKNKKKPNRPSAIPNVLIAGVQKGGTTAISHYLKDTHGACFSDPTAPISQGEGKESHFFDNWKTYNSSGLEYYQNVFKHCQGKNLIVDGTPEFMKTSQRIFDTYSKQGSLDKLKIIISLREPVSREISWYNHRLRDCPEQAYARPVCNVDTGDTVSFLDVVQKELEWKLSSNETKNVYGTYVQYLESFFELFDRKNILILSYEEAKSNQRALLQRIHKFLGLKGKPGALPVVNSDQGKHEMPPCNVQRALANRFKPYNEALYKLLDANPGPKMEQKPFPRFTNKCFDEDFPDDEADPFQKMPPKPSKHIVPNILVAGAQQTLVSAISKYCAAVMEGCQPFAVSETADDAASATHFFDNSNKFKKGLSFYQSLFEQCPSNETAVIDASSDLIMFPRRVREMYELQGTTDKVKMIFILRDPVHREIEFFHSRAQKCDSDPSGDICSKEGKAVPFEPFIENKVISKLENKKFDYMVGVYAKYLQVWFELWDRKQILILRYEELENKPKRFLGRIHTFLGIKSPATPNDLGLAGPKMDTSCEIREKMSLQFEEHNKALYELLEANPGPKMEQTPFPKFETHKCSS